MTVLITTLIVALVAFIITSPLPRSESMAPSWHEKCVIADLPRQE